jgi:hypothetical protein
MEADRAEHEGPERLIAWSQFNPNKHEPGVNPTALIQETRTERWVRNPKRKRRD